MKTTDVGQFVLLKTPCPTPDERSPVNSISVVLLIRRFP
ncbi:hypothetical protein BN8_03997 [Fibrisoma limi BUZ 3]|uniref:Uncharacterized protein n=1 Tax=Fibrisoma limi BUZ 3 TaxID=1185876 RepID=I2GLL6_9BACT|nr:hypothetical protein BN8_03997 [Fibrisoma limi BUZ 3]